MRGGEGCLYVVVVCGLVWGGVLWVAYRYFFG